MPRENKQPFSLYIVFSKNTHLLVEKNTDLLALHLACADSQFVLAKIIVTNVVITHALQITEKDDGKGFDQTAERKEERVCLIIIKG